MKKSIAWFARNHVAANLLMMFLIVAGAVIGLSMKLEIFPETSLDKIMVTAVYSGASPAEVEEGIIRQIEENISGLTGISRIDSMAREGFATVTIEVMKGWDLKKLLDEVKSQIDRITTFPEEADKPVVQEITRQVQVINVAVFGDAPEATLKHLCQKIKDDITNLPGITQAELFGIRNSEIHIEISEKALRRYGLTLGQVAEKVKTASLDLPAGSVKSRSGEILVRTKGKRYHAADYRNIAIITEPDGTEVSLESIARISEGFEDSDLSARFQGKPAAMIQVFRVADQNALTVAQSVRDFIENVRHSLPQGVEIGFFSDMSEILKSRIELLLNNMALGLILVSLLLGTFLNPRLAFWVTLGIPVSFLAALAVLPYYDVSINMISLFAFIMVLGIVVDDAIVIGENIFRKQEAGLSPPIAAAEGAFEVGRPVIFSVLTTIAAFIPLLMASGVMGKLMRNIPLVVILVLAGSLIESLFILPAHLSRKTYVHAGAQNSKNRIADRWLKFIIQGPYARLANLAVRWRYATFAIGIAVLCLTLGIWKAGWIQYTFFPKVESDILQCFVTMPAGTPVERTEEIVAHLEKAAVDALARADQQRPKDAPALFEYSFSLIGTQIGGHGEASDSGGHLAQIWIQLLEGEKRNFSAVRLTQLWREQAGKIADAESVVFKSDIHSIGNAIEVHLSIDDHDTLVTAAEKLKSELAKYPGVFDIADSFSPGKLELQLKLKSAARSLGITLDDLARQVRHAFYGAEALRLQREKDEVKVMVRYPASERKSLGDVEQMRIRTPEGVQIPFRQVAQVSIKQGYASIQRAQRQRVIKITADVDEAVSNANEIRMSLENKFLPELQNRYDGLRFYMEGEGKEQKESLSDVTHGMAIALFGIFALLAIPFQSFAQPLVVMSAIPFGLVGAVAGHMIMGLNLSVMSLMGMVGLTGVVVNDSLVLIDAANRLKDSGISRHESITRAGALRFRAIILTSVTTFAGLTPIILERSLQAKFMIPMAVSLGFGVLFATIVTLILVPCGYMILEDLLKVTNHIKVWLGFNTQPE